MHTRQAAASFKVMARQTKRYNQVGVTACCCRESGVAARREFDNKIVELLDQLGSQIDVRSDLQPALFSRSNSRETSSCFGTLKPLARAPAVIVMGTGRKPRCFIVCTTGMPPPVASTTRRAWPASKPSARQKLRE